MSTCRIPVRRPAHAARGRRRTTHHALGLRRVQRLFRVSARSAFSRHGRLIPSPRPTMRLATGAVCCAAVRPHRLRSMTTLPSPPRPDDPQWRSVTGLRCIPAPGHLPSRPRQRPTTARGSSSFRTRARSTSCTASCCSSPATRLPVLHLPDWEVLPYDQYSPLPDLISGRLATLARLPGTAARNRAGQRGIS